jgi:AraC family transcriptional activator of pobA
MKKLPIYGIAEFSEGNKEIFFYSNDLKTHLKTHQFVNSPHKHSTYISILFTKGTGKHQIDFTNYVVKPGSVFLLNPGQAHCWDLSEDANGYVFIHTQEFYNSLFANQKIENFPFFHLSQNHPLVYLKTKELEKIEILFREINQEFYQHLPDTALKLGTLINLLYIELSRLYQGKQETSENKNNAYLKVKKLQKLIDKNYKIKKFPKEYADMMNMTTRHLSRICQETLRKTTTELISDRIILEAKRMLIHKDIPISSVADELGYEDISYFTRLFKKNTGQSPKEFQSKTI